MGLLGKLFGGEKVAPDHVETRDDFDRIVRGSELPVVLYVWGEACGPCKKMSQEIVTAATRHHGRVKFAELSTSGDPLLLAALAVRATPTVIVFEQGDEIGRMAGFRPASWFDEMIAAEFAGDR